MHWGPRAVADENHLTQNRLIAKDRPWASSKPCLVRVKIRSMSQVDVKLSGESADRDISCTSLRLVKRMINGNVHGECFVKLHPFKASGLSSKTGFLPYVVVVTSVRRRGTATMPITSTGHPIGKGIGRVIDGDCSIIVKVD